jgi:hypothetical protein
VKGANIPPHFINDLLAKYGQDKLLQFRQQGLFPSLLKEELGTLKSGNDVRWGAVKLLESNVLLRKVIIMCLNYRFMLLRRILNLRSYFNLVNYPQRK